VSVLYEVNLSVDAGVAEDYRAWLAEHVREILALPGFVSAQVWRVSEPSPPADREQWCVQYILIDRQALQHYLDVHAPRLRATGTARFANRFSATRRVLRVEPLSAG